MKEKGKFSRSGLPVSGRYVFPFSRRPALLIGAVIALVVTAYVVYDTTLQSGRFISNGPLSSSHASIEADCSNCHTKFQAVTNEKCSVCHEKYGDELGVYTFDAHYLYRSNDFTRLARRDDEQPCFACHNEHLGREARITKVTDRQCLACHDFGSFGTGHPEFRFAAMNIPDDGNLKFPHAKHVAELQKRKGVVNLEETCLYCHNPKPDGKTFQPISFDDHCAACHLTGSDATPWLSVGPASDAGVETLQQIRSRHEPGTDWSYYMSSAEFRSRGSNVQKSRVRHEDAWIMENLRQLRRVLYPESGLSDLLLASADAPAYDSRVLHREALQRLREYADGLRARPEQEIQVELDSITRLIGRLEKRLDHPYASIDETRFALADVAVNPNLSGQQVEAIKSLAGNLTQPCVKCHVVENAAIVRVQKDQQALRRAEFNHRDHIVQARCLDCHRSIPIAELVAQPDNPASAQDRAEIQNLPTIALCRDCHRPDQAADNCVTCHQFHPDKSRRSQLLLHLE